MEKVQILNAIYSAVNAVNEQVSPDRRIVTGADAPLYGNGGKLDSLGLVNLIVAVEQEVEEQCGAMITLADEKALSQQNSPFRTIDTLADYVLDLISKGTS